MTDERLLIESCEVGADKVGSDAVETVMVDLKANADFSPDFNVSQLCSSSHLAAELNRRIKSVYFIFAIEADVFFSGHRVDERIRRQVEAES